VSYALLAMSHSPLLHEVQPSPEVKAEVDAGIAEAQRFVKEFDPDLIINFGPDHYNGFFYNLMPPFCVGYEAFSIGDFGSQAGQLDVPYDLAQSMAQAIIDSGVDTAISLHMEVDHGAIQPVELIYGDIAAKPIIPVFVNAVSKPFTPIARIRLLGEAIGAWAATLDKKVLFIASGGLSHDPPVPRLAEATPEQRAFIAGGGRNLSPEARQARQQRTINTALAFVKGEADIMELAPEWDRELMEILASGDLSPLDGWAPDWMEQVAGHSAHEVRTWIAGYAALGAIGDYTVQFSYYRPIKEYIAGFGITTVTLDAAGTSPANSDVALPTGQF
jgi:2,3-dihydroxyphenylpropionate 1,2-dioxygenase